jgi:HEAT repeat protein
LKSHALPITREVDWDAQLTNPPAFLPNVPGAYDERALMMCLVRGFTLAGGAHKETIPLLLATVPETTFKQSVSYWTLENIKNLDASIRLAEPSLAAALSHSDAEVRVLAAKLLERLAHDHAEVVAPLIRATEDPVPDVRRAALRSLGKASLPPKVFLPVAARVMDDPAPSVRGIGLMELIQSVGGFPKIYDVLADALHDPDPAMRSAAAKLLGHFGGRSKALVPQLRELTLETHEPNASVRQQASAALSKITSPEPK